MDPRWLTLALCVGVGCGSDMKEVMPAAGDSSTDSGSATVGPGPSGSAGSATSASGSSASDSASGMTSATTSSTTSSPGGTQGGASTGEQRDDDLRLESLRAEVPCTGPSPCNPDLTCLGDFEVESSSVLQGDPDVIYDVTLRVRGLYEGNDYSGGTQDGGVYVGGGPDTTWNTTRISTSDPEQVYWLNNVGADNYWLRRLEYDVTVPLRGGAELTLWASTGTDLCLIINRDEEGNPIVIDDLPQGFQPFDGQFVDVAVLDVVAR